MIVISIQPIILKWASMHRLLLIRGDGYVVDLFCIEVSVRGQISKANRAWLKSFLLKTTGLRRNVSVELICKMRGFSSLFIHNLLCMRRAIMANGPERNSLISKIGMHIGFIYYLC